MHIYLIDDTAILFDTWKKSLEHDFFGASEFYDRNL
ncbi:hypothetical protein Vdis_1842 [Vulcanisaeta distributa DSM 14429]|uniref:Uncharacterized protein n=1 Tax=Vulcanisaeta distributa (strain DSM 14429 / JCM 11212 / NBRC 100878 / IC-017) TaxID=572478 RepID=E1QV23_VULDI|nr:hypothetical protein Vdis_1842 [Vulcanisaeta distributa DSM 14429]